MESPDSVPPKTMPSARVEILITIAGLLGAILFFALYDQAFPSAALELSLSRNEISRISQETVQSYGYNLDGYQNAMTFSEDWLASVYLQRVLGVSEANRLIQQEDLPIWNWRSRWFQPLQKEEFSLSLSPNGAVTGFAHSIAEDAPGANLEQLQARALAEAYLVDNLRWDPADWELVSASSEEKPGGRSDHYFEWKERGFQAGEGDLRISVSVQGDRIGSYDEWLKVPEGFRRQYQEERSRASFISGIAYFLGTFGFGMGIAFVLMMSLWRRSIPVNRAVVVGLGLGLLSLLTGLNGLALDKIGYPTTQPYLQFWFEQLFSVLLSAVFIAGTVTLLWAGGERAGKLVWQRQDKILPLSEDRWVTLARSSWRGLMLFGIMGAYIVLFYIVATRLLGGWIPFDVDYSNQYATPMPFLAPLWTGLLPGVTEELLFRLAGIALILGVTRMRWLALLVPGVLWAFAHVSYVRDPIYMRGIELTIVALIYGMFFLYFGLWTTILAHAAFNATLGALPLLRSGEPYFFFSGLVVILVLVSPILPGLVISLKRWLLRGARPPPTPQVQPATSDDLPGLLALPVEDASWEACLADPQAVVVCLKTGDELVGAASGRLEGESGVLTQVYVSPAWRNRYWGSRLTGAVRSGLEAMGAKTIRAAIPAAQRDAASFLAGQGWLAETRLYAPGPLPSYKTLWSDLRSLVPRRGRLFRKP